MSLIKELLDMGAEAAKDATKIEMGRIAFQKMAAESNPENPDLILAHCANPFMQICMGAGTEAVANITGQKCKATDVAAEAMAAYGYHNLVSGFGVKSFIGKLADGAIDLVAGDEGVPFEVGKKDTAQTKQGYVPEDADGDSGPSDSIGTLNKILADKEAEAEKKGLRVCPRCVAQLNTKPIAEAIKAAEGLELHKPQKVKAYAPKHPGILEKADKWADNKLCGNCRDMLNREVNTAYKAVEGELKKLEEIEELETLLNQSRKELKDKFDMVNGCLAEGVKWEDYIKNPDDEALYANPLMKAGAVDIHADITKWQTDIKTIEVQLGELKAEVNDTTVEDEAKVDNANAKESVTAKETKAQSKGATARNKPAKKNKKQSKGKGKKRK